LFSVFVSFSLSRLWLFPSVPLKRFRWPGLARLLLFIEFLTWVNVRNSNLTRASKWIPSNEHNTLRKRNGMKTCSDEGSWLDPRWRAWLEWNWWKWFIIRKTCWTKNFHVSRNYDW
jgi:hypothetical protein